MEARQSPWGLVGKRPAFPRGESLNFTQRITAPDLISETTDTILGSKRFLIAAACIHVYLQNARSEKRSDPIYSVNTAIAEIGHGFFLRDQFRRRREQTTAWGDRG
jgi:hypothetical protein